MERSIRLTESVYDAKIKVVFGLWAIKNGAIRNERLCRYFVTIQSWMFKFEPDPRNIAIPSKDIMWMNFRNPTNRKEMPIKRK